MTTPSATGGQPLAAQRQFYVVVAGITGYFATKTGGETTAEVTDVYDGGNPLPEKLSQPATHANIVVGRPFRPARDLAIAKVLRQQVGKLRTTASVQSVDADGTPYGAPTIYRVLLVRETDPEADAASGDAARLELEFAVESIA